MPRWLALVVLWLAAAAAGASGLPDLLDLPAEPGEHSLGSMLLDVAPAGDRWVAVGEYGTILYSDDDGVTWRQAEVPVQVTLTAVYFPEPRLGWAVGHDAVILHSSDGGETWERQLDGRRTGDLLVAGAEAWQEAVEQQAATWEGDPDSLMLLEDAATTAMDEALRELETGPNRPLLDVWFADARNGYAVGAFNYFFVTNDGGKTWYDGSSRLPNPEFLHLYGIAAVDTDTLILAGEFGLLLRSVDGGATWERLDLGYEGTLFTVTGGEGEAWIGGLRGNVFYSPDGGSNWQHLPRLTESSLLGSLVEGRGKAHFVGLSGTSMEVDEAKADPVHHSSISPLALAAAASTEDHGLLVVGLPGIIRLDDAGRRIAVRFAEGGH